MALMVMPVSPNVLRAGVGLVSTVMRYLIIARRFQPGFKFFEKQYQRPQQHNPGGIHQELQPLQPGETAGTGAIQQDAGKHQAHSDIDQRGGRNDRSSFRHCIFLSMFYTFYDQQMILRVPRDGCLAARPAEPRYPMANGCANRSIEDDPKPDRHSTINCLPCSCERDFSAEEPAGLSLIDH